MNWARGLLRLWVVIFVVWTVPWIFVAANWFHEEVFNGKIYLFQQCAFAVYAPVDSTEEQVSAAVIESYKTESRRVSCSEEPVLVESQANPYVAGVAISQFRTRIAERPGELWYTFFVGTLIWLAPPGVILALGAALLWAMRGFRSEGPR